MDQHGHLHNGCDHRTIHNRKVISIPGLQAAAQVDGRIITNHTETKDLVWSDVENEWMFFDKTPRTPEYMLIETKLNSQLTGKITITAVETSSVYTFTVYETRFEQPTVGDMMVLSAIEQSSGDKCTILIHKIGNEHMVSVMLPSSNLAVYFDNIQE